MVCMCVAPLDCQYLLWLKLPARWKTVARCTALPLAVASGIIADFTLTDYNSTRNKGKIVQYCSHTLYASLRNRNAHGHRRRICRGLQGTATKHEPEANLDPHCARACAVEMRMDISLKAFLCENLQEK